MPLRYQVESVTKVYDGRVVANDDVTLEVRPGEVFGLLGPNGAGKSTLVRQMVGLLAPDRGSIRYAGSPVTPGDRTLQRQVSYLSQRPLALLDLTVREAITYTGRLRGLPASRAGTAAARLIEELGLADCAGRVVARLSGGQHRLVALGSALIGEVETLVLDEPTSELDPEMRRRVWQALKDRCRAGATVVLVTHHALEAEQVIDRLAVLLGGRVIAVGSPGEIKAQVDARLRIELTFRAPPDAARINPGLLADISWPSASQVVLALPRGHAREVIDRLLGAISWDELDDFRVLTPTLEDVYLTVASTESRRGGEAA